MLTGVTVLDFALQLPGPYATMLLRQAGARVVRVEPPTGDPARRFDPAMVAILEDGKDRLRLDLREPAGVEVAHRLAERVDVVVEGFRPGVADRLGLGAERLRAVNPRLVYCSISGYGQSGRYRGVAGHDLNYLAMGGGLPPDAAPRPHDAGLPMVDLAAGTAAAFLITAALRRVDGAYIDLAMLDWAVFWSQIKAQHGAGAGSCEPAYGVLRAGDGLRLTVGVVEDRFWRNLCAALGWERWAQDPELSRYEGRRARGREIFAALQETVATRPRREWLELFLDADVPAAPLNAGDEVALDPQVAERRLFAERPDGRRRLDSPLPLALRAERPATASGGGVLRAFGFSPREVADLEAAGVVSAAEGP